MAAIIPKLQIEPRVIQDIQNAVNSGEKVTVSKSNITYGDWVGCGYIILNPGDNSGQYMISGGTNGGELTGWRMIGVASGIGYATGFLALGILLSASAPLTLSVGVVGLALLGFVLIAVSYWLMIEYLFHETEEVRHWLCIIAAASAFGGVGVFAEVTTLMATEIWGIISTVGGAVVC